MKAKALVSFALAVFLTGSLLAQTKKPLINDDILQMVKAGFEPSMIVKAIEANETNFDVSVQGLMDLKTAAVPQAVIEAMLEAETNKRKTDPPPASTPPPPSSAAPKTATSDETWPAEVAGMLREIGAFYKQPDGKFIELYGKPIVATSTGGFIKKGLTMGLSKIRSRGQLPGKHAQLQVAGRQPTFYLYMPEEQKPEAVSVVKMESKGDRREFEVGAAGGASGSARSGLDVKKVHQIVVERLAHRLFRIMPDSELEPGEYGLIGQFTLTAVGVAGAGEKVYDFGIVKKKY